MLKNIKLHFKVTWFILVIAQIIILLSVLIIYLLRANQVAERILDHEKLISTVYRDIFNEYLEKKFRLILEDEMLIGEIINKNSDSLAFDNCEDVEYNNWFEKSEIDEIVNAELFNSDSKLFFQIFQKYLNWKDKMYITIEYISLSNSNIECRIFPKPSNASISYYRRLNKSEKNYNRNIKNKISRNSITLKPTINKPQTVNNLNYSINKLCTQIENIDISLCLYFTFYDLYLLRNRTQAFLEPLNTILYILYTGNKNKEREIVYSSAINPNDTNNFACKVNNEENDCTPSEFFYIFFKEELDQLYSILTEKYKDNIEQINQLYNEQYNRLKSLIGDTIIDLYNKVIENSDPEESFNYKEENILTKNDESYLIRLDKKVSINETDNEVEFIIEELEYNEYIFLFPVMRAPTIVENSIIFLGTNNFVYYIMIRAKNSSLNRTKIDFRYVIAIELVLFFFYLLTINCLVWYLFLFFYYYIFKSFAFPLKKIKSLYNRILETSKNNSSLSNKALVNRTNINRNKKKKKTNSNSKISKFFEDYKEFIIQKMTDISQIEKHEDISQTLITLNAISLIIEFNSSTIEYKNIQQDHDYSKMNSFFEAIQYLSDCFYAKYTEKAKIDFFLVKLVCENIFFSMLKTFNKERQLYENNKSSKQKDKIKSKENKENSSKITEEDIHNFFGKVKKAIRRSKNELQSISKGSIKIEIAQQAHEDLYSLSLLEEHLFYLYSVYQGKLFDDQLMKEYLEPKDVNDKKTLSENIDEEERKLLEELRKKRLREQTMDKIRNKDMQKEQIEYTFVNNPEKQQGVDITLNNSTIKSEEKFSEDLRQKAKYLIKYIENYYDLKQKSLTEGKNFQIFKKLNTQNIKEKEKEKSLNRTNDFVNILQDMSMRFQLSKLYIIIDEDQKGIKEYETALEKLKLFESTINSCIIKTNIKWKATNFVLLTIFTVFYEKFLFIFSMLCNKYSQSRNEMFINLNILALSPLYSKSVRKIIVHKLLRYLSIIRSDLVERHKDSLEKYKKLILDNFYLDLQRSIYKMISLRNAVEAHNKIKKKVLFVFDLSNTYIKDSVFKDILFHYFKEKKEEPNSKSKCTFYFSAFDSKLHLQYIPKFNDEEQDSGKSSHDPYSGKSFHKKYLEKIVPKKDSFRRGTSKMIASNPQVLSSQVKEENIDTNKEKDKPKEKEDERITNFFNFLSENQKNRKYSRIKEDETKFRADKAIYHAALFGLYNEEGKVNKSISNSNRKSDLVSSREANYLLLMASLSSKFTDNKQNWKVMAELMYERKYTLIVILSYDPEIDNPNNEEIAKKLENYKHFVKNELIDGYLFIMRSLAHLKFILNTILPINFNAFNSDIIKHYLYSLYNLNQK